MRTPRPPATLAERRALLAWLLSTPVATALAAPAPGGASAPGRPVAPAPVLRSRHVGTNLSGIAYYGTQFPFANMLKCADPWSPRDDRGAPGAPFAALTPDGYPASLQPGQHAVAAVAWPGTRYPAGRYTVLWDGSGSVSVPMSKATVLQSAANRLAVEVTDTSGALWVGIDRTAPADPVRNLRFLWPGTEATHARQPFTPEFLEKTAPFSVLRFMDWGQTNGSSIVEWSERTRTTDAMWTRPGGVPIETMIALANTLRADPWFCIPHQASDDYVTRFAGLLRDQLDPALRAHIEYSNEVWNGIFPQSRWAVARSDALGLPKTSGTPAAFYAQRSVQVFKRMQQVFGPGGKARLVRVIAGQSAWGAFQEAALAWQDTAANTDVLAIAPYFQAEAAAQPSNVAATLALAPEQVLDQMLADVRGRVRDQIVAAAALATKHRLTLKGYEAGPDSSCAHFPADRIDAVAALFAAVHRLPRMQAVSAEYHALWIASGGDTLNQYSDIGPWSRYGNWGALEFVTQDPATSPKYRALLDAIQANPSVR